MTEEMKLLNEQFYMLYQLLFMVNFLYKINVIRDDDDRFAAVMRIMNAKKVLDNIKSEHIRRLFHESKNL